MRGSILLMALWLAVLPAAAQQPLPDAARDAIREVISRQIEALKRDDAAAAFALASPGLRAKFGTADKFMETMRTSYAPIYRPRSFAFQDIAFAAGKPVQKAQIVGEDGKTSLAYFSMERQANGVWRIAGCLLAPVEGRGI